MNTFYFISILISFGCVSLHINLTSHANPHSYGSERIEPGNSFQFHIQQDSLHILEPMTNCSV